MMLLLPPLRTIGVPGGKRDSVWWLAAPKGEEVSLADPSSAGRGHKRNQNAMLEAASPSMMPLAGRPFP